MKPSTHLLQGPKTSVAPGLLGLAEVTSHADPTLPIQAKSRGIPALRTALSDALASSRAGSNTGSSSPLTALTPLSPVLSPVSTSSLKSSGSSGKTNTVPTPEPVKPVVYLRGFLAPWSQEDADELPESIKQWLPDIRAAAPTHLQIQNAQQREMLRFSNSLANTGKGNWQVRRGAPITDPDLIAQVQVQALGIETGQLALASQELVDSNGTLVAEMPKASVSEYHEAHKHFHLGETAEFGIDKFDETKGWDPITGLDVVKTTFCLIDVNQIQQVPGDDPNHYDIIKSPANANLYNDCFADVQGVQAGWMDRYHHQLPGQEVDVTNLPAGIYRISTTVNPSSWYLESDYSNNFGWTAFELSRDSNGNGHITMLPEHGGIWFTNSQNGMG